MRSEELKFPTPHSPFPITVALEAHLTVILESHCPLNKKLGSREFFFPRSRTDVPPERFFRTPNYLPEQR